MRLNAFEHPWRYCFVRNSMKSLPAGIPENHPLLHALQKISNDIRLFIELSLHDSDDSWEEWLPLVMKEQTVKCWEKKPCMKKKCPAYLNANSRCWLIAGTMCGGKVQGEFAVKYKSCTECDVYQESVFKDLSVEIYEHLITLVHNFKATQDKLKTMATRDILTGLYNRNYFNETVAREIERARRYGDMIAITIIDINNFKEINDTYGHLHGDGILREFSRLLVNAARKSDIVCRFGGDEFLIVSPKSDCRKNLSFVTRLKKEVSDWNREFSSEGYELSYSIGCSSWERGRDLHDVLNEADQLMFKNKQERSQRH